jgi:hypothetical protein
MMTLDEKVQKLNRAIVLEVASLNLVFVAGPGPEAVASSAALKDDASMTNGQLRQLYWFAVADDKAYPAASRKKVLAATTRKYKKPLAARVSDRLVKVESELPAKFSPEVIEALQIAERLGDIKPDLYVLPLDALAGFQAPAPKPRGTYKPRQLKPQIQN